MKAINARDLAATAYELARESCEEYGRKIHRISGKPMGERNRFDFRIGFQQGFSAGRKWSDPEILAFARRKKGERWGGRT